MPKHRLRKMAGRQHASGDELVAASV